MNIQNIIENNLLLFAVNVLIKKPQVVNIQNIVLGRISHHTSLKEALIIIEDILIFDSTVYEPWEYEILREKWAFKAHGISLDFYLNKFNLNQTQISRDLHWFSLVLCRHI